MSEITVDVLFFASLREQLGRDGLRCTLAVQDTPASGSGNDTAGAPLTALMERLRTELGASIRELESENVRIAVNQQLIDADCVLRDGDEIGFLPPVTGG